MKGVLRVLRGIMLIGTTAILVALIIIPVTEADQECRVVRYYVEHDGKKTQKVQWCLAQHKGFRLTYKKAAETHLTQTNENLETLTWSMDDPTKEISIKALRKKNILFLHGRFNGETIDRHIRIDSAPWFQATSLSLKKFVTSDQKKIEFWTFRVSNLKAYKLSATKIGRVRLTMAEKPIETIKIEMRLTGWRSYFWKSDYWFKADDGLFLRFEGQSGPSGKNRITINYSGIDPTL
jgi:hypothetical protein